MSLEAYLQAAMFSSRTHESLKLQVVGRPLSAHVNQMRQKPASWNGPRWWWSIRSTGHQRRWSHCLPSSLFTRSSYIFVPFWKRERFCTRPKKHKPEASEYTTAVCRCCPKCSTQPGWVVCDDRWEPQREEDNPSGTFLGDKNDNSKQVCN